jgi:uncharacterized repeat protein (TIGR02059 family)/uncharacterized repeat protein (TIGR02543 family)
MRINNAYKAITKLLIVTLFTALFSLINISQPASAALFGIGYSAAGAGGSGGDTTHGPVYCSANMAAVGVGLTVNGNSPGFGIYCRALGADGQLVAQDQSSVSNTTAVGGGTNKVFCPAGKVLTGFSFIIWSNVGIRCSEPPALSTQDSLIWYSATTATSYSSNCSTGGIVTGFWWRTGAWTDAIGAYCNPFAVNTLSYNVNGGSGTAPASQNAPVTNQVLTISNTYSGTKSNFHYLGWNDLANGSGNDYVPGTSETITSATNLYAKWGSYINYDGNGNSSGTAPSRQEATTTAANTELAMNTGNLAKTNYTFAGWNTAANGTGTSYPSYGVPALPANPYMQFDADHYDAATKTWADISGNSRNITSTAIRGAPSIVNYSSDINGATGTFKAVAGGTSDGVQIKNSALPSYTFCHVSRYSGTNRLRIFAGTTGNWLSGYWNGNAGVAYHEGWITSSVGTNDTNWRIQCDTGSSATANSALRSNGNLKSSVSTNMNGLPANISINLQGSVTAPTDTSDWEVAEFVIYDSVLSNSQINEIESVLRQKYGVKGLNSDIYTWNYTSTGDVTLYAQWNSAITYNGNGNTSGTAPASQTAIGQKNLTLATNSGTLAKTGFTFGGWNSAADGSGTKYAAGLTTFVSSGNATLYAQWNSTITYNANTATSGTIPTATSAISAYSNTTLASNTGSLAKTGYTFNGWNTAANGTGTHYDAGITNYQSAGSATLYAEWTSGITYNSNSADSGTAPATQNITGAGTSVTLATNSGSLTRTGFTFAGWNTTASGSGTTYAVGASYTIAGAITLYAKWTSVITFNNNSSTSGAPSVTSVTAIGSTNTTLASQSNLARTGYTFNGWNTAADGSGTNYVGGLITYVSSGNITLYANWGLIATGVITTVTGTYGNSQVALTWSVPATVSGAGAVTDYTIQYSTDNTNWTTFSHSASITRAITVTGLTNGTPYYFRVAGYNGTNGPFATSATVTPMRVPDAPTSVLVSHTDAGAATSALVNVSWTAPSNNGGSAITNYQWSIDGTSWQNFKEGTVTGTSGTAFGLAFSTSYSIYVRAVNIVGGGAASLASTPITVNIDSCQPRTITVAGNTTYFFDKPGVCSYQFTSTSAKFAIAGASGGAGSSTYDGAGQGGRTTGTFTPAISTTYYFYIGEAGQNFSTSLTSNSTTINTRPGGFNGGGAGGGAGTNAGASGGGATDIRTTTQLNSRLVVAGGGGGYSGSYGNSCCGTGGYGSNGGGLTGGSHAPNNDFAMASAGTQSAGGNQSGGLGAGGAGGSNYLAYQGAGGGGGGYYGGGGGYITNGCGTANGCWPSGGAGGSSYPAASNSLVATYTHYQGGNCGNGYIAITYDGSAPTELTNGCGATTAPTLSTATINTYGNVITLTYNRALSAIIPDKSQFVVTVNGTSVTINSAAQGSPNTTILLTLANYVPTNSVVRVSYTDTSNYNDYIALQDSNGFDAASFVNQTIVTSGVVNPHTVTFVANGGTGTMNAQVANSATALTANAFTRRAYTFAGWNTNANGTGTNYANSVSFPFTTDLTIYAKWTAATFTVTTAGQELRLRLHTQAEIPR